MPISTYCVSCRSLIRLPDELAGKQVRCQKCNQLFIVPGVLQSVPVESPAADRLPNEALVMPTPLLLPEEGNVAPPTPPEPPAAPRHQPVAPTDLSRREKPRRND